MPQDTIDEIRQHQQQAPLVVRAYSADGNELLSDGELTLIDNAIDQSTGTIHLKARFANRDERLWPGEFVNLRVILMTRPKSQRCPRRRSRKGRMAITSM